MKQDLNGVRTAQDLERKYDLAAIAGTKVAIKQSEETLTKIEKETSNLVESLIINLEGIELNSSISLWFYDGEPTLSNDPAVNWNDLNDHVGDFYYDRDTGYVYQFVNSPCLKWEKKLDGQLIQGMALTNASIDTSDHERQVFFDETPIPPYSGGDWYIKENSDLYICQISRTASESYSPDDFIISSQYTYGTNATHVGNVLTVMSGRVTKVEYGVDQAFSIKVSKDEVVSEINASPEQVKISSGKISLEGYTTINQGFTVDLNGNMTCNNATINGSKLTLGNNTEIVGNDGLLATMMIDGNVKSRSYVGGTCLLPVGYSGYEGDYSKDFIEFDFEIPNDFVVKSAYVILDHVPVRYSENGTYRRTGYSRKMKLYKSTSKLSSSVTLDYSYYTIGYNSTFTEITGAFGDNGYTGSSSAGGSIKSTDIKNEISTGFNLIKIETSETAPSSINDMFDKTGACKAVLYINGYTKFS